MELILRAAPFFLLPLFLQWGFLTLGWKRPRLRFTRWLLLLGAAVPAALALREPLGLAGALGAVLVLGAALVSELPERKRQ